MATPDRTLSCISDRNPTQTGFNQKIKWVGRLHAGRAGSPSVIPALGSALLCVYFISTGSSLVWPDGGQKFIPEGTSPGSDSPWLIRVIPLLSNHYGEEERIC